MITHPASVINSPADLTGKTFAFGDKGSTSGQLIPSHYFMTQGIDVDRYFSRLLHTSHQAIEKQVTERVLDAGDAARAASPVSPAARIDRPVLP